MDFTTLKRKELQALCKEHGIRANLTNVEMTSRLKTVMEGKQQKRSKSCFRSLKNDVGDVDDENEKVEGKEGKKVRFSPQNETYLFERTDPREQRLLARKMKTMGKSKIDTNPVLVIENVGHVEEGEKNPERTSRRRAVVKPVTVAEDLVSIDCVEKHVGRNLRRKSMAVFAFQDVNNVEIVTEKGNMERNGRKRSMVKSDAVIISLDVGNVEKPVQVETLERNVRCRGRKTIQKDVETLYSPSVEKNANTKRGRKENLSGSDDDVVGDPKSKFLKKGGNEKSVNVLQVKRRSARQLEKDKAINHASCKGKGDDNVSNGDVANDNIHISVGMALDSKKQKRAGKKTVPPNNDTMDEGKKEMAQLMNQVCELNVCGRESPVDVGTDHTSNEVIAATIGNLEDKLIEPERAPMIDLVVDDNDIVPHDDLNETEKEMAEHANQVCEPNGCSIENPVDGGTDHTSKEVNAAVIDKLNDQLIESKGAPLSDQVVDGNDIQSYHHLNEGPKEVVELVNLVCEPNSCSIEKVGSDHTSDEKSATVIDILDDKVIEPEGASLIDQVVDDNDIVPQSADNMNGGEKEMAYVVNQVCEPNSWDMENAVDIGTEHHTSNKDNAVLDKLDDQVIEPEGTSGSSGKSDNVSREAECNTVEISSAQRLDQFIMDEKMEVGTETSTEMNVQPPSIVEDFTPVSAALITNVHLPMEDSTDTKAVRSMQNPEVESSCSDKEPIVVESQTTNTIEAMSESPTINTSYLFMQSGREDELTVIPGSLKMGEESNSGTLRGDLACIDNTMKLDYSVENVKFLAAVQHLVNEDCKTNFGESKEIESKKAAVITIDNVLAMEAQGDYPVLLQDRERDDIACEANTSPCNVDSVRHEEHVFFSTMSGKTKEYNANPAQVQDAEYSKGCYQGNTIASGNVNTTRIDDFQGNSISLTHGHLSADLESQAHNFPEKFMEEERDKGYQACNSSPLSTEEETEQILENLCDNIVQGSFGTNFEEFQFSDKAHLNYKTESVKCVDSKEKQLKSSAHQIEYVEEAQVGVTSGGNKDLNTDDSEFHEAVIEDFTWPTKRVDSVVKEPSSERTGTGDDMRVKGMSSDGNNSPRTTTRSKFDEAAGKEDITGHNSLLIDVPEEAKSVAIPEEVTNGSMEKTMDGCLIAADKNCFGDHADGAEGCENSSEYWSESLQTLFENEGSDSLHTASNDNTEERVAGEGMHVIYENEKACHADIEEVHMGDPYPQGDEQDDISDEGVEARCDADQVGSKDILNPTMVELQLFGDNVKESDRTMEERVSQEKSEHAEANDSVDVCMDETDNSASERPQNLQSFLSDIAEVSDVTFINQLKPVYKMAPVEKEVNGLPSSPMTNATNSDHVIDNHDIHESNISQKLDVHGVLQMAQEVMINMPEKRVLSDASQERHLDSVGHSWVGEPGNVIVSEVSGEECDIVVENLQKPCELVTERGLEVRDITDLSNKADVISSSPCAFENFTDQLQEHNASPSTSTEQINFIGFTSASSASITTLHGDEGVKASFDADQVGTKDNLHRSMVEPELFADNVKESDKTEGCLLDDSVDRTKEYHVTQEESEHAEVNGSVDACIAETDNLASDRPQNLQCFLGDIAEVSDVTLIDQVKTDNSEDVTDQLQEHNASPCIVYTSAASASITSLHGYSTATVEMEVDTPPSSPMTNATNLDAVTDIHDIHESNSIQKLDWEPTDEERVSVEGKEDSACKAMDDHPSINMPEKRGLLSDASQERHLDSVDHLWEGEDFSKPRELGTESGLEGRDITDLSNKADVVSFLPCGFEGFTEQLQEQNASPSMSTCEQINLTLHETEENKDQKNSIESCNMFSSWEMDWVWGEMAKDVGEDGVVGVTSETSSSINEDPAINVTENSMNVRDDVKPHKINEVSTDEVVISDDPKIVNSSSSMIQREKDRSIMIHGTLRKPLLMKSHDMKENAPALKMVDVTAVKPIAKRKALEDLRH